MKKIFRYAAIICAAALAVACAEEPQDEPIVESPTTKDLTFTTDAATPDSRVLFADGEGLAWESADLTKMAVCYNEDLTWKHTCSTSGTINEGKASFTATVDAESVFAYCYYPYAENNSTDSTFAYNFATDVAQSEAGRTTALRLASDVISIEGEATNVTAQFRIVGSLLRYFIYADESDEKVEKVTLKASAPVAGTYTYNLASAEGSVGGNTSNEVTVTLGTALSLDGITAAEKAKSVFMPIVPATSEGVTYVVTTDKNVYEFTSTAAHTWAEGAVTEIKLNLAKATKVTPIGGGETIEPEPSDKQQLYYLFREKTGGYCEKEVAVESAGKTLMNNAWFLVGVGGTSDDKLILSDYNNQAPYRDLRFECPEWMEYTHDGGQNISLKVLENTTTEERVGTFKIYSNVDTAVYEVVYADGETITIEDPVFEVTVTQAGAAAVNPEPSNATTLYYHFTDKGVGTLSYNIMATGETKGLGWYSCYVGGQDTADGNLPAFKNWRMEAVDANGNVVDWITASPFGNTINLTCAANTGEARSATVDFYWDDTEEFVVIGTIKTADRTPYDIASGNFTSADPILTITINQEGKSSEPTTLYYHFTDKGIGALHHEFSAAGQSNKDLGWYSCFIGGKDNATGTNACFQQWIAKAYDENGNEVNWVYATPKTNENRINLTCEPNAGDARTATVKLYWVDSEDFVVIGTIKTADRTPYDIASGNFTSADPILELTVNQAAGN